MSERGRVPGHGHDHSHGAGESKNTFAFHVSSPLKGQKPKGASATNLKPTKVGKKGKKGVVAPTPEEKIETETPKEGH